MKKIRETDDLTGATRPPKHNEDGDSSGLSTEFYEEYYRLLSSLKKDDRH